MFHFLTSCKNFQDSFCKTKLASYIHQGKTSNGNLPDLLQHNESNVAYTRAVDKKTERKYVK